MNIRIADFSKKIKFSVLQASYALIGQGVTGALDTWDRVI